MVVGVGTLATSDGPDVFGDPLWDDATLIATGAFGQTSSYAQAPVLLPAPPVDANLLTGSFPSFGAVAASPILTVTRSNIPEPATWLLAMAGVAGFAVSRRRGG